MTPSSGSWSTKQLSESLVAVAACRDQASAISGAIQWAAEALEAEVAAMVRDGAVVDAVGFARGQVPDAELVAVAEHRVSTLELPGIGSLRTIAVPIEGSTPARLLLGRSDEAGFSAEETNLLRAMARGLALTLDSLRMLEREHELRVVSER